MTFNVSPISTLFLGAITYRLYGCSLRSDWALWGHTNREIKVVGKRLQVKYNDPDTIVWWFLCNFKTEHWSDICHPNLHILTKWATVFSAAP